MKKTFSFILKSVVFFLPVIILWAYLISSPMSYVDGEAPSYYWNRDAARTNYQGYMNTIIIGDSAANAAYMPEVLSSESINLALGGSTPVEDYYVLEEYLEHNEAPSDLFVTFSDENLGGTVCFYERAMFSHRFPTAVNWRIIQDAREYDEETIATDDWFERFVSYELYLPDKYMACLQRSTNATYFENTEARDYTDLYSGRYIGRSELEYYPDEPKVYEAFEVKPLSTEYYRRIIDLATENGIRVHLIKLPQPNYVSYSDYYRYQVDEFYSGLIAGYDNVEFRWYENDGTYTGFDFGDPMHANNHGATKFSCRLKADYPEIFSSIEHSEKNYGALWEYLYNENDVGEMYLLAETVGFTVEREDISESVARFVIRNALTGEEVITKDFTDIL